MYTYVYAFHRMKNSSMSDIRHRWNTRTWVQQFHEKQTMNSLPPPHTHTRARARTLARTHGMLRNEYQPFKPQCQPHVPPALRFNRLFNKNQ
jgi:uncharacterized protein (DUF2132 family)